MKDMLPLYPRIGIDAPQHAEDIYEEDEFQAELGDRDKGSRSKIIPNPYEKESKNYANTTDMYSGVVNRKEISIREPRCSWNWT